MLKIPNGSLLLHNEALKFTDFIRINDTKNKRKILRIYRETALIFQDATPALVYKTVKNNVKAIRMICILT